MRKLTGIVIFIVSLPLIGSILIKPDKRVWKEDEDDTSVINECFEIAVREDVGTFYYKPEILTRLMMYRAVRYSADPRITLSGSTKCGIPSRSI